MEKKEQAEVSGRLMVDIFGAFREARKTDSQTAFLTLQDKIAEHAGELVRSGISSMKELVDTLMKLDGVAKDDGEEAKSNETALQLFLRKSDDAGEGMTQ